MISIRRKQLCLSRLHILYMKGLFYHWAIFLTREDVYLLDSASCAWIRLHVSCFELGEAGFQKERERTLQLLLLVSSSLSLSVAVNQTGVGGFFWQASPPLGCLSLECDQTWGAEGSCSLPRGRVTLTGLMQGQGLAASIYCMYARVREVRRSCFNVWWEIRCRGLW